MTERIETPDNAVHLLREALEAARKVVTADDAGCVYDVIENMETAEIVAMARVLLSALSATAGKP